MQSYALSSAAPSAPVVLLLAPGAPSPLQIGPCVVQPNLAGLFLFSVGATDGNGALVTNLPVPADTSLVGGTMTAQELIVVMGGPLPGIGELSNGAFMTIGL
jgi:hypothetical protein